jgi:hypothetical protein
MTRVAVVLLAMLVGPSAFAMGPFVLRNVVHHGRVPVSEGVRRISKAQSTARERPADAVLRALSYKKEPIPPKGLRGKKLANWRADQLAQAKADWGIARGVPRAILEFALKGLEAGARRPGRLSTKMGPKISPTDPRRGPLYPDRRDD